MMAGTCGNSGDIHVVSSDLTVGFIGAGKMSQAIIKGLVSSATVKATQITGSAVRQSTLDTLKALGVTSTTCNSEVAACSDIIFLGVKPHLIGGILQEVASEVTHEKLVASIAAGVTLATLEQALPEGSRVVRVMPSLPAAVGCGTSAICLGTNVSTRDGELISALLSSCGFAEIMPESYLDVVTATGAAMIGCVTVEAMADGAVKMGLPRHLAIRVAAQSLMGAAKLVLDSGEHPAVLKDAVCSPGGTTIAGLHQLELGGYRGTLISAVEAATVQARKLGCKNDL